MGGDNAEVRKGPRLRNVTTVRPGGTESSLHPTLEFERDTLVKGNGEVDIHRANLTYDGIQKIEGFIFRKSIDLDATASVREALEQWRDIKTVKDGLRQTGQSGFNIPKTVRGVISHDGVTGILMSDLTEGGKNEVIDLKQLRMGEHPFKISREQMEGIRTAVIQDMDIAKRFNIKLVSGSSGLDPWMVILNKKTGDWNLCIVDIGKYTSKTNDPFVISGERTNDPEELYKKGRSAIDKLCADVYAVQAS